jgi:GNAT superfamily N-acetyltransferase
MAAPPLLTFLLDTNAVIALEPYAGSDDEQSPALADLLRLAREHNHHVVVHPANYDDLRETADEGHRAANLRALRKYELIGEPPIADDLRDAFGSVVDGSNDHRDLRLLAAAAAGAATHLVTNDRRLLRRAARAGLEEQVLRPAEALTLLRTLYPEDPTAPPQVHRRMAAELRLDESIFDSLRKDYAEFDQWIRATVAPDPNRRVWTVEDADGGYRAIAIVKLSDDHPLVPGRKLMKISTFKVDERAEGEKLGELLLKTVLGWAATKHVEAMFVTVIKDEAKQLLVRFLETFGFDEVGQLPGTENEWVFEKTLRPEPDAPIDPLAYHVRYGPPAIAPQGDVFVVPIQPHWYGGLFPDSPAEEADAAALFDLTELLPFGNALRKAYLSNSKRRALPAGAVLLFYRSAGDKPGSGAVRAIGVVERTLRSADPSEVLAFVGRRTVYSAEEVAGMCQSGVIAVLFRQDRFLAGPWSLDELIEMRVLRGAPQAITQAASDEGRAWVLRQLSV